MASTWQKWLFEILYSNRYLYRFASTVPFAGHWRTWQRLVLPRLIGHNILELGCGLGDLLADMIEAGYDCRAIEQSKEMVGAARETLQQRRCGEPDWIVHAEVQHLLFPDASFDTVVSTFPSDYIYDPNAISEIERVLRPGGHLIVVISANLLPVDPIGSLLLLFQMFVYGAAVFSKFVEFSSRHENTKNITGINTEVIPDTSLDKQIPLERYGLSRLVERVYSKQWSACIVTGEKPTS